MASIIRVKRSTGTIAPATLNYGELAYTIGVGTHGNRGQRLFIGDNSQNPQLVGGQYYTDLLSIAPGLVAGQVNPTTAANGFVAILDQNRKVDQWNVDNLRLDGNTLSSENTDGDINIDPNGSGEIVIPDDTYLVFGTSKDTKIKYDEVTDDRLEVTGADWNFANGVAVSLNDVTNSTSTTTGAFVVTGGVGVGASVTIGGSLDLDGNFNIDGGLVSSNTATLKLFDSNVTRLEAFREATQIEIGATTGIATIRNETVSVPNATTVTVGALSSPTTVTFRSTTATSYVSIAATNNASSTTTGALRVAGGVGIASDVYIGGNLNVSGTQQFTGSQTITGDLTVNGNVNLGNQSSDLITVTGIVTHTGTFTNRGGVTIDNIGISSNVISTKSGGGNTLYIDPYPDGLSNQGLVVVKGDLQVDGTTTTVNSNSVTINEAVLKLGEVTSVRTVGANVSVGSSNIVLDSVSGINTGDVISNGGVTGLPASAGDRTITYYNTSTNQVSIAGTTTSAIGIGTQLTITHAYDTNTDRGISFDYNTSSGTANNKTGFFGYHDGTNVNSGAPERSWTFIPDATLTNSVATGTRGYLDIKGIYYQTGDFSTHGIVYFDSTGLQNSTTDPASATITSTQLLTAVTEINLTIASAYSVTAGQQVTQVNNSSAYGVVKTSSSGTTITLIGVQGTFDTTNDLKVEGSNISRVPSNVSTIYTSKPMWTSTIDGGTF